MTHILYETSSGHVAVATIANDEVDVNEVVRKFREVHPEFIKYGVYKELKVPGDRKFRDAWVKRGGEVVVHEDKAKAIHLSRIREARNKKLDELDKEVIRAISDPTLLQDLEDRKQHLRDIPQTIKLDINNWPKELT